MPVLLFVIAGLQIGFGLLVWLGAKSAIHEILAVCSVGFGFMSVGFAATMLQIERIAGDMRKILRESRSTPTKS